MNALWEWTAVESVPVTYKAMLPSSSSIKITLGAGVQVWSPCMPRLGRVVPVEKGTRG